VAILFIGPTHIGDAVLSTGLLAHLLAQYPDQQLTIACGAPAAKVFAAAPRIEAIHVLRKQRHHRHWLELWRGTRGRRWDLIVDLRRSAMPYVLRSRRSATIPKTAGSMHRVELIAKTLGLPPRDPVVWTEARHRDQAEALLGAAGGDVLALAPGANWIGKTWPAERFAALADLLTGAGGPLPGARVMLVGSKDEREAATPIMQALPPERLVDAFGVDVLTTFELLARCRLMVGNDSAMMHLAAATGIPTVGLFGPTRDDQYGPWGPNGLVIRTPESIRELIGHRDYDTRTTGTMMLGLTPEHVAAIIAGWWPSRRPATRA